MLLVLLLAGCSSSWKAPLEVRDQRPVSQPTYSPLSGTSYRVRKGDTLYAIAWRSGRDFRQLARWNGLSSPYTIYPGQTLRLTAPPQRTTSAKKAKPAGTTAKKKSSSKPAARAAAPAPAKKTSPRKSSASGSLRWAWPTDGRVISTFQANDHTRQGIKISGREGQPVKAAEGGKVVYSGSGLVGYGRLIIIKHNNKYLSAYGHNRRLLVKEGEQIVRGQRIAEMGRSNDGKPVLHFEIRRVGKPVDPLRLLPRR